MKKFLPILIVITVFACVSLVSCAKKNSSASGNHATATDVSTEAGTSTDTGTSTETAPTVTDVVASTDIPAEFLKLAESVDFTALDAMAEEADNAGLADAMILDLEKQSSRNDAPPNVFIALSVLYGRKGLKAREYAALLRAEESAQKRPNIAFNVALVYGRKKLLEGATDADAFLSGSVDFDSEPRGASVLIDGEKIGVTPLRKKNVKAGIHTITFEARGYPSVEESIDVGIGASLIVRKRLLRSGSLMEDGFELYGNGESLGEWKLNARANLAYRLDSAKAHSGDRYLAMTDTNNGDRAHMYWDFPAETASGAVTAFIRVPSVNSPDLAEVQLKSASVGDIVDVEIMRDETPGTYKAMYLGENARGNIQWGLLTRGLRTDEWIEVRIAFSNARREAEIHVNGEPCGIYAYRASADITRLELNGGGWGNARAMEAQFDDIRVALGSPAFDDTILIKGGTYTMGNVIGGTKTEELPAHQVTLDDFYMGRAQVTAAKIAATANWALSAGRAELRGTRLYAKENGNQYLFDFSQEYRFSNLENGIITATGDVSMGHGSWYLACATLNWLSEQKGLEPAYNLKTWKCDMKAGGYRLPTEAEWEYAARNGGKNIKYPWGDAIPGKGSPAIANLHDEDMQQKGWTQDKLYFYGYVDGSIGQNPVNMYPPSALGLKDMYGNLWELVADTWYPYEAKSEKNPLHEGGNRIVVRGAGYDLPHDPVTIPDIYTRYQHEMYTFAGFRMARRAP